MIIYRHKKETPPKGKKFILFHQKIRKEGKGIERIEKVEKYKNTNKKNTNKKNKNKKNR